MAGDLAEKAMQHHSCQLSQLSLVHRMPCSVVQMKQICIEDEYKLMLQPQQLNEQLREANLAKDLAEQAMQERTDELNEMKANAESLQAQYLADIEAQHAVATEQLEAAYDKRFLVRSSAYIVSHVSSMD